MRTKTLSITAAIASLAVAGGLAATFTTTNSAPAQKIGSGSLAISLDNVNPTVWTDPIANLAAGDSVSRYVNLRNSGTLDISSVTMSQTNTLGTLLADPSDVTVSLASCSVPWTQSTGTCLGTSTVVLAPTSLKVTAPQNLNLSGSLPVGKVVNLRLLTTLSQDAPNDRQSTSGAVTYTFSAGQRASSVNYGTVGNAGTAGNVSFSDPFNTASKLGGSWMTSGTWSANGTAVGSTGGLAFVDAQNANGATTLTTSGATSDATMVRFSPADLSGVSVRSAQESRQVQTGTSTYYTCDSGGTLSGSYCDTSYTKAARSYQQAYYSGYYSCNSGDSLSGTTCSHQYFGSFYAKYNLGPTSSATPGTYYYTYMTCGGSYSYTYYETWYRNSNGTYSGTGYSMSPAACNTSTYNASYVQTGPYYQTAYTCDGVGSLSGTTCYVNQGYTGKTNTSPVYTTYYTSSLIAEKFVGDQVTELGRKTIYDSATNQKISTIRVVRVDNSIKAYADNNTTADLDLTSDVNVDSPYVGIRRITGAAGADAFATS